jgi:glycogen phosphorylase
VNTTDLRRALDQLARNQRWTWRHRLAETFERVFERLPKATADRHPVDAVADLTDADLAALAADPQVVGVVQDELASLDAELATRVTSPDIAYYSPEFGISERVPLYSGGLGVLAGDHVKAASDLGTSLAAVGLFYREGFFRQQLAGGGQAEQYETYTPERIGCTDTGVVVEVPICDRIVRARVWRLDVGRVPLLLLDTDVDANSPADRRITDRLYSGDASHRLAQELVLGVGGARAVASLGWRPGVHHLNEGHAGFLVLELLDTALASGAPTIAAAAEVVRPHILFTTHTPVPAGIDRFDRALVEPHLQPWATKWRVPVTQLLELGADPDEGTKVFNMAASCLRVAARANAVSSLHGDVSRALFARVPGGDAITSVTNGVHARTWVNPALQDLFDRTLGDGWHMGEPAAWAKAISLLDSDIVAVRATGRDALARLLAARAGVALEPEALVVGFARRFATYKRATLLLRHREALAELLADDERPVHLVFAGKAHPADTPGKALLADVVAFGGMRAANQRFSFVVDYDMAVARTMFAGCDVWLNTPVRPYEASGTSGEKAALNGAVNCSIRDGWWAEMSDGRNGVDIATSTAADERRRDDEESANALAALRAIAAEFHADGTGTPSSAWLDRMRYAWATLGPKVTAARMVRDYDRQLYSPMLAALR